MSVRMLLAVLCAWPGAVAVRAQWKSEAAFPNLTFTNPTLMIEAPRNGHLYIAEAEGRIYTFQNDPATTKKSLVLDISAHTQGGFGLEDCGLLGMAFHPDFGKAGSPNRGYLYVWYSYTANPVMPTSPTVKIPDNTPTYDRLSRFTVPDGALAFDPASELVLIDQKDKSTWHEGGGMLFHPKDGFLYLTNGDEGCSCGNSQVINKSLFSGVLRLDVDMRGGAISHPIKRQPVDGKTANYFIPNDNPFVGQDVLEEFWSIGLRSPHRMTYDAQTDLMFIGEVGAGYSEEIDIVSKSANFQWDKVEGLSANPTPTGIIGTWTKPVSQYLHNGGAAVIGGYVYRGCANQATLGGKYLFADFVSNKVSALSFEPQAGGGAIGKGVEELLNLPFPGDHGKNGVTSFGTDAQGELYLLLLGKDTRVQKLTNPGTKASCPVTANLNGGRHGSERDPFRFRALRQGFEITGDVDAKLVFTIASLSGKVLANGRLFGHFAFLLPASTRGGLVLLRVTGTDGSWNRSIAVSAAE